MPLRERVSHFPAPARTASSNVLPSIVNPSASSWIIPVFKATVSIFVPLLKLILYTCFWPSFVSFLNVPSRSITKKVSLLSATISELEFAAFSCLYRYWPTVPSSIFTVTIRVISSVLTAELGLYIVDCIIPTNVFWSGVIVKPSIPRLALLFLNSAGSVCIFRVSSAKALIRPISLPKASKCTICGPYSSLTQNVPSFKTARPSPSKPKSSVLIVPSVFLSVLPYLS